MNRLWLATAICMGIFMLCLANVGVASQIPISLDWRNNIFIQEVWVGGTPRYCVANLTDQEIRLQLSRWISPKDPIEPLKKWDVSAKTIDCLDADAFLGEQFLNFQVLEGPRLGLLKAPAQPIGDNAHPGTVTSYQGLNGACRNIGIKLSQDRLWFNSGEKVTLTLITPADTGEIIFDKATVKKYLPLIEPQSLVSSTLPILEEKERLIINTNQPVTDQAVHNVQFNFVAPKVSAPTLFQITAQIKMSEENWGCFVRGILIKP